MNRRMRSECFALFSRKHLRVFDAMIEKIIEFSMHEDHIIIIIGDGHYTHIVSIICGGS